MLDKKSFRKKALEKRKGMSESERKTKSQAITTRLERLPEYEHAKTIMIYLSMGSEVETNALVKNALKQGKKIVVPVTINDQIQACGITSLDPKLFSKTSLGVREPLQKQEAALEEIDLVVVPGMAFTEKGERLGRGKGCYDRFLEKIYEKTFAATVALAFELQLFPKIPVTPTDQKVKKIVTEKRLIACS
jgi:5-formyltetrahydrofolate cyclo-ligase